MYRRIGRRLGRLSGARCGGIFVFVSLAAVGFLAGCGQSTGPEVIDNPQQPRTRRFLRRVAQNAELDVEEVGGATA